MSIKKLALAGLISGAALVLQACGGGSGSSDFAFLVTNTNKGHVCVEGMNVNATTAEAQTYANALYYYYGYRGGVTDINSGEVSCSKIHDIGGRDPDFIISLADFNAVVMPAYLAKK